MVTGEVDLKKKLEYYLGLHYTMTVKYRPEQGGYYVAGYVELPDLTMTGNTPEEAVRELLVEQPEWFETCLKLGVKIPLPADTQKYSGKIVLRMPPSMHKSLVHLAESEGVSLNQYMIAALARTIGFEESSKSLSGHG